jgi:exoribonuclease II
MGYCVQSDIVSHRLFKNYMKEFTMSRLDEEIRKAVDNSVKYLEKGERVRLSTCSDWEKGYYGANAEEHQAIKYVVEVLARKGFRVQSESRHGVMDYYIDPIVDINKFV